MIGWAVRYDTIIFIGRRRLKGGKFQQQTHMANDDDNLTAAFVTLRNKLHRTEAEIINHHAIDLAS